MEMLTTDIDLRSVIVAVVWVPQSCVCNKHATCGRRVGKLVQVPTYGR